MNLRDTAQQQVMHIHFYIIGYVVSTIIMWIDKKINNFLGCLGCVNNLRALSSIIHILCVSNSTVRYYPLINFTLLKFISEVDRTVYLNNWKAYSIFTDLDSAKAT